MVNAHFANAERLRISGGKIKTITRRSDASRSRTFPRTLSIKYHGLVLIDQYPVFQMPADSLSKNALFQILSLSNQVFNGVAVTDPHYVLGDNRTLVKRGGNVVRRCPDNLDAPGVGLVVRPASGEGWQKTVVNIDNRDSGSGEKMCVQNLHIASEYDQIDPVPLKNRQLRLLRLSLAVRPHIDMMKRQVQ